MTANIDSFLTMIAISELGDELLAVSENGYNVIVGSTAKKPVLFSCYKDHPRVTIDLPKLGIKSSAAGRYQILAKYFDAYKKQLGLPDFSPLSQDRIAIQMIRECKALSDIESGRIPSAIEKCRSRWASLPGAGYGQKENKLSDLLASYKSAGGVLIG
ncbi:MAG: glycoside hydrolase family 24 protein [Methylobacter sp.]